jgi:L-gulonate 3-dehydrogenase
VRPLAPDLDTRHVAVVGAGSIGVGWAVVFARAGLHVAVFDPDEQRRAAVIADVVSRLSQLARGRLLDEAVELVAARVVCTDTLDAAVDGVVHVQECAPEVLDLKRDLFARLDAAAPSDAVLASSSSALTASSFASALTYRGRCLVAHPGNPPYLLSVVELVPAPFTGLDTVARTRDLFALVGMSPVLISREVEGFVFNRLQGALLREAYCLVRDGVADVEAVDLVVRDGLGRRWAVCGPFETAELNTRGGIEAHADTMGPAYARMGSERGQNDPWTPDLVAHVAEELHRRLPADRWDEHVAWRDEALIALEQARRESALFQDPSSDRA